MKYLLVLLLPIFLVSAKAQDNNISIDKINGIYVARNTHENRKNTVVAICRNQKTNKVKIAFSFLIDLKVYDIATENKKVLPENWQPYDEEMILSKSGTYDTFTYTFEDLITSYMRVDNNSKIYGATIVDNGYHGSYVGEKLKDHFEIIDMKTKKVLEICRS